MRTLLLPDFDRAILHIDGDSFFAGCEVAKDPSLQGKCVVVGKERGMATAMTYEAKARGVKRGMMISEIRKLCPEAIILPSDYETYSLFSKRMFEIVRRYTPTVEEYSIDECFAELTGWRRALKMSYETMAERIKHDLDTKLGMTFSVGLAPTKVLAKVASKWKKPDGLTVLSGSRIEEFLGKLPVEKVWGIGPQTTAHLASLGIRTALQFIWKPKEWVEAHFTKPHQEIWHELRGTLIYELTTEAKHDYQSISKTKTFSPSSSDHSYVLAQLSKNIENACIKARRHNLAAKEIFFYLKTHEFRYRGLELKLPRATNLPIEIMELVKQYFDRVFAPGVPYRSTGVVLMKLESADIRQADLFGTHLRADVIRAVYQSIDTLSRKYGKHTVFLGSSFEAVTRAGFRNERGERPHRLEQTFKGETKRKRLGIPMLGEVK